ncbi:4Fe-4S dicluster domain-containing protein [Kutzneria viridogrisea]|uniref:Ferredoxin n=1 Tax=Kutzneria viridogrisea TaxID=47990 RepID=A0ABR6BVF3_9PSEU|nr:ferredoxin [Kutzneria viridogrisea]
MEILDRDGLNHLVDSLLATGHRVIGPTVRDSAIVLDELSGGAQLPDGWGVEVAPGSYRLRRREDMAVFAHSAGPQSWKQFVHPARRKLWQTDRDGEYVPAEEDRTPLAFLGVRGCDLAALGILGQVLGDGPRPLVIAANCTEPGGLCFCSSMGTGPAAGPGYDLVLTELLDPHRFLVEVGTPRGARALLPVPRRSARGPEVASARSQVASATGRMGRVMPEVDLRTLLRDSSAAQRWNDVAQRCLTCGNCTMVCPTCFCTSTEDVTDLTGQHAERWQHWVSCFEIDFSHLHGGSVRTSAASRYRQWLTHKLSSWYDQFGSSGCVGCGRCIGWCPVGIDITEEAAALAAERSGSDARA